MKPRSYASLIAEKSSQNAYITYAEKLFTIEWREKREAILARDNRCCRECQTTSSFFQHGKAFREMTKEEEKNYVKEVEKKIEEYVKSINWPELLKHMPKVGVPLVEEENPTFLHVHHKYYIEGKLPWEYSNDALVTLCHKCHQTVHEQNEIPVYSDNSMRSKLNLKKCGRCKGSGYLDEFHYYFDGICFQCNGNMYDDFTM